MRRAYAGAFVACVVAVWTQTAVGNDGQIAQLLSETLRDAQKTEELKGFRINVKVENGVVWMKGSVKDKLQREKALDLARRVEGVRLVVNDLKLEGVMAATAAAAPTAPPAAASQGPPPSVGTGLQSATANAIQQAQAMTAAHAAGGVMPAGQMGTMPVSGGAQMMPVMMVPVPYATPLAAAQPQRGMNSRRPVPVRQQPRTRMVNYTESAGCPSGGCSSGPVYDGGVSYGGGYGGGPMPEQSAYGHGGYGHGGVVYDEPQMPAHAWPGYAAHPNYAALQYPTQYSPQAWPYIGPFYPYPQVPLGWRKVALEWDDGWWWLDFKSK